jgi:hypothetical protein
METPALTQTTPIKGGDAHNRYTEPVCTDRQLQLPPHYLQKRVLDASKNLQYLSKKEKEK